MASEQQLVTNPVDVSPESLPKPVPPTPAAPVSEAPNALPVPAVLLGASPGVKSASVRNTRGRELLNQGRYREAIEELNEALRQQPDFTLALNARGFAYYLLLDYPRALADFDEAIRLNPKYLNAYQNRSLARKASGDAVGSAADEQKLRELGTHN